MKPTMFFHILRVIAKTSVYRVMVSATCLVAVTKCPDQSRIKEGRTYFVSASRELSIMAKRSWKQEAEAAGHTALILS